MMAEKKILPAAEVKQALESLDKMLTSARDPAPSGETEASLAARSEQARDLREALEAVQQESRRLRVVLETVADLAPPTLSAAIHKALYAPLASPPGERPREGVADAVDLLETVSVSNRNVVWSIARITNTEHAISPRGEGFGVEVAIRDLSKSIGEQRRVAWEKAGGTRTVLTAAKEALRRLGLDALASERAREGKG